MIIFENRLIHEVFICAWCFPSHVRNDAGHRICQRHAKELAAEAANIGKVGL